jgi:hypothetical protein
MIASVVGPLFARVACAGTGEVDMARTLAALSVLAVVVLGVGGVVGLGGIGADEPAVLLALVGTALCALGCVGGMRTAVAAPAAVVVRGRRARGSAAGTARQHHPDTPGRPRPRAPGPQPAT